MKKIGVGFADADDGQKLYFTVVGDGFPMAACNGIGVSTFFWKHISREFSDRCRILTWDYRGHGRTPRPKDLRGLSMQRNADDLVACMDAVEMERALILGHSMGVQVCLEAYRRHPDRVLGMVLLFGTYGRPADTFFDLKVSGYLFPWIYLFGTTFSRPLGKLQQALLRGSLGYGIASLVGINPRFNSPEEMAPYFEHLRNLDPELFFEMAYWMANHSCESLLPEIEVPVLIVAGDKDTFTPVWASEKMLREMPNAEMLYIREGSHAGIVEHPELINLRLEKFLRDHLETEYLSGSVGRESS